VKTPTHARAIELATGELKARLEVIPASTNEIGWSHGIELSWDVLGELTDYYAELRQHEPRWKHYLGFPKHVRRAAMGLTTKHLKGAIEQVQIDLQLPGVAKTSGWKTT
jgi:hypothetical protein